MEASKFLCSCLTLHLLIMAYSPSESSDDEKVKFDFNDPNRLNYPTFRALVDRTV